MPLTTEFTTFTRDVLGRYICNTFDEMLVTIDPSARAAAGLPARDLRPFDFIIIGGGTFGSALAEHLWFRSANRRERILVLEAGPFLLPEHVQNLPVLGLGPGDPRKDHQPQKEVWGTPWNSSDPIGFPGLAYCLGGRSVYWGGWSPRLLPSELPNTLWPQAVLDDLTPKNLPDGSKGYFRQSSDQIGVTQTNDFVFGDLHNALRAQLMDGLSANLVTDAMDVTALPDHPAVEYSSAPVALSDLAALLGISLPDPLPTDPGQLAQLEKQLRNLAKLEAPLAVQGQPGHAGFFPFNKFSAVPLLTKAARESANQSGFDDVMKRLMVVPRCHVMKMNTVVDAGGQRVSEIVTERGTLTVSPDARVIVALGTVESSRLAMLSFGEDGKRGRHLMAHLRSNLDFRVPRAALSGLPATAKALEASALFVKGQHQFKKPDNTPDGVGHFHFQITASGLGASGNDSETELFKKIPDIDSFEAHKNATDTHVVITVRGIGEMEPKPDSDFGNSVTLDLNPLETDFLVRRAFVNLQPSSRDLELWNAMDKASDDVAKIFANGHNVDVLKGGQVVAANVDPNSLATVLPYKFSDSGGPGRRDGLGTTHHEAGTLRMGDDPGSSVANSDSRFHDVTNTYVAGPSLFPRIGSPNPMLTGIALVRRLADHLMMPPPPAAVAEAGFTTLFDGTAAQFANWEMAGFGSFTRVGATMVAQQDGRGIGLFFYKQQKFENFILRLDFMLPHPRGFNNDNSGVFVRFRDPRLPDPAPDPTDPSNNSAFVAVHTGYEVQIDEEARGNKLLGEADGSFYARTGAIYKIKTLGTAPGEQNYQNTMNLAAWQWHHYEIEVNNQEYIVRLNGVEATRFTRAAGETVRGNPPSVDPDSGYIGIQTHTGNVAFANIRIK